MRLSNKELKSSNYSFTSLIYSAVHSFLIEYPTPYNINYFWNFGFIAGLFLIVQIFTGVFLAMYYTPHIDLAFLSVDYIMRDLHYGWLVRYLHSNGASMFFIAMYLHIFKGLYYGSYKTPRKFVWCIGVIIYILTMATAFIGYVLPWGQMSFWGATVITNFVTVIPFVGKDIVTWLWGGFSINNATLNRFFSLHYLLPFVILGLVGFHLIVLHESGGNNPSGFKIDRIDKVSFYPYSYVKDLLGTFLFFMIFFTFVFFFPEALGHSDNYIEANPIVTPNHIVPEWYFLPFYAILRSILHKTWGIVIMFLSLFIFMFLPFFDYKSQIKSSMFKSFYKKIFWLFLCNLIYLGVLGAATPISPYIELGLICTHFHLLFFTLIVPMISFLEWTYFMKYVPVIIIK
uniref:Cytochrome b n=1 Tax=Eukaryota sp. BB2 TaxID=1949062 RepID=A0A1W5QDK0_9EUKA|nr:apocytochrome b [Eukaryota sp. BB2]AQL10469.1 apocytochrome b [Eukaryota sp. BB2]